MKVIILENGITAKTLNPLGKEPNHLGYRDKNRFGEMVFATDSAKNKYADDWEAWQQAEQNRKIYEIEQVVYRLEPLKKGAVSDEEDWAYTIQYKPGTIHEATLLPNGKIKIKD